MRTGVTNEVAPIRSFGELQFGLRAKARRHQLGFEGDVFGVAVVAVGVERPQLDPRQRLAAVADHQVPVERVDGVETDVVAVLDERAERGGVAHRRLDEGEVLGAVVVQDEEAVFAADDGMLDGVLDELAARPHRGELGSAGRRRRRSGSRR